MKFSDTTEFKAVAVRIRTAPASSAGLTRKYPRPSHR